MILITIVITLSYLFLISGFIYGFDKIEPFKFETKPHKTTFSVIIPFRNEAEHLPKLLESIQNLNYNNTLFEVILVNDDSEDPSVEIINTLSKNMTANIKIIQNERASNSPKKDALTTAINKTKNEWIITTDADCVLPKYWLDTFDAFIQKNNTACIAAPVTYASEKSFLNHFQILDLLSLQGATIGGFGIKKPFLCNGANFAYKKSLFIELSGFQGNSNIASGDDLFLLEKVTHKYPKHVHYLKTNLAIVETNAQPTWEALISQRVRWAAKTTAYKNGFGKLSGILVFLMNLMIIISFVLTLLNLYNFKTFIYLLIIKSSIDYYLIFKTAVFLNKKEVLKSYLLSLTTYPFFSIYVAMVSIFSSYNWKGRTFKK